MSQGLESTEIADLYRRYGLFLRRRCLVLLRNRSRADDALQEMLLKLMRVGGAYRQADHPLRWLYRAVDRACFDQLKKDSQSRPHAPDDSLFAEVPSPPAAPPELRNQAVRILASLGDEDQQIAVMAFVDGMTQQQIADELGYSRMTIVKRVARIREAAERSEREASPIRGQKP